MEILSFDKGITSTTSVTLRETARVRIANEVGIARIGYLTSKLDDYPHFAFA